MEDKIESERNGKDITSITELNLDNCKTSKVVGLSENWTALEKLSLINVGLTSLEGFPNLPKLKKLKLCDNRLSDGFEHLNVLSTLSHLNLSGNKITDFKKLEPLNKISTLKSLNLVSCNVSSQDGYKEKIFSLIPSLTYLDGFDKDENPEVEDGSIDEEDLDDEEEDLQDEEDLDEEEEISDEEEEEEEEDIPLKALYEKSYTNDTADDDDFEVLEEEEDEIDEEIDEEEEADEHNTTPVTDAEGKSRGTKRKHEEEEVQQNGKK